MVNASISGGHVLKLKVVDKTTPLFNVHELWSILQKDDLSSLLSQIYIFILIDSMLSVQLAWKRFLSKLKLIKNRLRN